MSYIPMQQTDLSPSTLAAISPLKHLSVLDSSSMSDKPFFVSGNLSLDVTVDLNLLTNFNL